MTIDTYVSLVFPAVCNVTLEKLNSSTGFNTTNLVVTVLNNDILPPLRTSVVSVRAMFKVPSAGTSFVLPFVYFIIVTVCKCHAGLHDVNGLFNWVRWTITIYYQPRLVFNWVILGPGVVLGFFCFGWCFLHVFTGRFWGSLPA